MRVAPQSWKEVVVYLEIPIVLLLFGTCNVMRAMGSGSGAGFSMKKPVAQWRTQKEGREKGGSLSPLKFLEI